MQPAGKYTLTVEREGTIRSGIAGAGEGRKAAARIKAWEGENDGEGGWLDGSREEEEENNKRDPAEPSGARAWNRLAQVSES